MAGDRSGRPASRDPAARSGGVRGAARADRARHGTIRRRSGEPSPDIALMTARTTPPGVFRCLFLLALADAATRVLGLRRTLALVRRVRLREQTDNAALID